MSESALKIISREEGFEARPYLCSRNYPTVGYGQKIGKQYSDIAFFDFVIPEPVASLWMQLTIDSILDEMELNEDIYSALESCNETREAVLISMAYQMGVNGLAGFKKMLSAVEFGDWDEAAAEGLNSRWAKQTPERANRQMEMMKTGRMLEYYY